VRVPAENRLPGANSFRDCAAVLIEVHFIAAACRRLPPLLSKHPRAIPV